MPRHLKILMITVRADFGGGPEHLFRLISNLSEKVTIYIAAPDDVPYFTKYAALVGNKNMIRIPHREFKVKDLFRLEEFVRKNGIDLIHSHGKGGGIYSRLLHLMTGKPVIHTFHGLHIDKYTKIQAKLYIWLERFFSSLTTQHIAVSQGEYNRVMKLKLASSLKTSLIENGVVIPEDTVSEDVFDSEVKNILTITRFDFAKNSELLIPILERLIELKEIITFRFVLVGTGENLEDFKNKVGLKGLSNYFVFAGTTEDISKYYLTSFCYISTSRWEGLPLSVMEAMAAGLPVIATNVTGNNDLIENESTGFLYNLDEPEKAAELIVNLCKNKTKWSKISEASRNKISANYSVIRMAQQTEKLYFKAIKRKYIE